jgi:hypothetical protein
MSFLLSHVFSSTKLDNKRAGRGRNRRWQEVSQTMYTHVSKYKNDKIKGGKKQQQKKKMPQGKNFISVFSYICIYILCDYIEYTM